MILTYEEVFGSVQSIGGNPSFSLWLTRELVLILPTRGFYQLHGEVFFTTHKRIAFVSWTHEEVLPWHCTLFRIWLMIWTHGRVSLSTSTQLRDVFYAFNPLGIPWGCLCLLPNWRYFYHFLCILEFYFALPTFRKHIRGYLSNLFNFFD